MVEHCLGSSRGVVVDAPRHKHDEHPGAPRHRLLDDIAVVRRSRNDGDALLKCVELLDALLPADTDYLVATVQRVLHHVLPELRRGPDDADPHRVPPVVSSTNDLFTLASLRKAVVDPTL